MVLNCFGRKNQVYASIVGITRKFGFYVIAVKTMATMIIKLLTFYLAVTKVILHLKTLYVMLLSKLKPVNFII